MSTHERIELLRKAIAEKEEILAEKKKALIEAALEEVTTQTTDDDLTDYTGRCFECTANTGSFRSIVYVIQTHGLDGTCLVADVLEYESKKLSAIYEVPNAEITAIRLRPQAVLDTRILVPKNTVDTKMLFTIFINEITNITKPEGK